MTTNLDPAAAGDAARQAMVSREYNISLTLSVTDPEALWIATAERLLTLSDMSMEDVEETIGPREDPSIGDCLAALASPCALPGCRLVDIAVSRQAAAEWSRPGSQPGADNMLAHAMLAGAAPSSYARVYPMADHAFQLRG